MTPRGRAWLLVAVWVAFLLTLTSIPGRDLPSLPLAGIDKVVHAGLYGVLGLLVARGGIVEGWTERGLLLAWVALVAFGGADELHQLFVPGRSAEWRDWMTDTTGAGLGLAAGWFFWRRWVKSWAG